MRTRRSTPPPAPEDTFLPSVARAADRAMEQVLEEDYLLHAYGIPPKHGRSR